METDPARLEHWLTHETLELRGDGKAGSGVVLTLQALAACAIADPHLHVQEWPFFSSARKGAPTRGFLRLSRRPIEKASEIAMPHIVIVMDDGVIQTIDVAKGLSPDGIFIMNTKQSPETIGKRLHLSARVFTINGDGIATRFLKKPLGNISVFALLTELIPCFEPATCRERLREILEKRRLPQPIVQANLELFDASLGKANVADVCETPVSNHIGSTTPVSGDLMPGAQSRLRLSRTNLTATYARSGFRLHFEDPENLCNGCGHCIMNCPENIIRFVPDPDLGVKVIGADITNYCKLCRECIEICPKKLFSEVVSS